MTVNFKFNFRSSEDKAEGIICWNIANSNLSIKPRFCVREGNGGQLKNRLSFDLKILSSHSLSFSHEFSIPLLFVTFCSTSLRCSLQNFSNLSGYHTSVRTVACEQYSRHPFPPVAFLWRQGQNRSWKSSTPRRQKPAASGNCRAFVRRALGIRSREHRDLGI